MKRCYGDKHGCILEEATCNDVRKSVKDVQPIKTPKTPSLATVGNIKFSTHNLLINLSEINKSMLLPNRACYALLGNCNCEGR